VWGGWWSILYMGKCCQFHIYPYILIGHKFFPNLPSEYWEVTLCLCCKLNTSCAQGRCFCTCIVRWITKSHFCYILLYYYNFIIDMMTADFKWIIEMGGSWNLSTVFCKYQSDCVERKGTAVSEVPKPIHCPS